FFLLIALAMIGPGQELGRALQRLPNRVQAYSINILGSVVGIVLFAACSYLELPPPCWFLPVALGLGYFLLAGRLVSRPKLRWGALGALAAVPFAASLTTGTMYAGGGPAGQHFWSPYYRIDYQTDTRFIITNLIGHQAMWPAENAGPQTEGYAL